MKLPEDENHSLWVGLPFLVLALILSVSIYCWMWIIRQGVANAYGQ